MQLGNATFSQTHKADHVCIQGSENSCGEEPDLTLFSKDM